VNARVGYYLWELMIVWDGTRGWGNVHGIFYPDGTIRDPSIPMAVMGIFRNRGPEWCSNDQTVRRVTRVIARPQLATNANGGWSTGLTCGEGALLLESAQLVLCMSCPPARSNRCAAGGRSPALRRFRKGHCRAPTYQ
jgi:hypothetical protein